MFTNLSDALRCRVNQPGTSGGLAPAEACKQSRIGQGAPTWKGMGTTIAAELMCGQRAAVAHVGDSRVYRLRGRALDLLTEDHSLFNDCVRARVADPEHPEDFALRHVMTRALGTQPAVEVERRLVDVAPGDTLLHCSDGLHGVVPHRELCGILLEHERLDEAVHRLVARANDRGGPDNVTCVLVRRLP